MRPLPSGWEVEVRWNGGSHTTADESAPIRGRYLNGWCSVKPAWLLLIEHLLGEDGDRRIELPLEPTTQLRGLVDGDRGLGNPPSVMARLTPPKSRRSMVLEALDTTPPDQHSEFALTYLIRDSLVSAGLSAPDVSLQAYLDRTLPVRSIVMEPAAAALVEKAEISPVAVPLGDSDSMLYHDRRTLFLSDPDYSVMCGLATTAGLASLGLAAAQSSYVRNLVERGRSAGRRFAGGLAIDPAAAGYDSLTLEDWVLAVGFRATSVVLFSPARQLAIGYSSPYGVDRLEEKSELIQLILNVGMG